MNRRHALSFSLFPSALLLSEATLAHKGALAMIRPINPTSAAYAAASEVVGAGRLLFVSGQVPVRPDDTMPADFASQCRVVWANIERQLRDAGMSLDNIVKVTTFLSDRRYRAENSIVRREVLKERAPALTIIITGIYDEAWLLEIEVIAAA
jgi:2-iminobutanoate/2-iminopropanoate deaminase